MRGRRRCHGIVNGIDVDVWNPEADTSIAKTYSAKKMSDREANRKALAKRFKLTAGDGPVFIVISRLTYQKGLDVLAASIDQLVAMGGRLAVLGTGDAVIEGRDCRSCGPSSRQGRGCDRL